VRVAGARTGAAGVMCVYMFVCMCVCESVAHTVHIFVCVCVCECVAHTVYVCVCLCVCL